MWCYSLFLYKIYNTAKHIIEPNITKGWILQDIKLNFDYCKIKSLRQQKNLLDLTIT